MTTAASGLGSIGAVPPAGAANSDLAALTGEDFLQMLITQLTHQDPTEPMDNKEILEQLSNIRTLDANNRLIDAIDELTLQNRVSSGASLMGKEVLALAQGGSRIQGVVNGVLIGEDDVTLTVLDSTGVEMWVPLSNVLEIREGTSDDGSDQSV